MQLILGLGKSGLSCARYFARQHLPFAVMDTRNNPPGLQAFQAEFPHTPIYLGGFDLSIIKQADAIVASPGLELPAEVLALNIPIIGDIELFARVAQAPIVAITGTNAKGTVTTLIGEMIRAAGLTACVGGNIGTPALELLEQSVPDFYVLEISSFQLETTSSLKAQAATILNISEDHLDRHKTMVAYIAAKQRVYQNCITAVCNRDDEFTYPKVLVSKLITFGFGEPKDTEFGLRKVNNHYWLAYGKQNLLSVDELLIQGKHNWMNALAALALGTAIHLPMSAMLQALSSFKGLLHRCEWVAKCNDVIWYNDSKGTNIGATLAAINGLGSTTKGKLVLIAGGLGKGADFTQLREAVAEHVKAMVLIGKDAPLIEKALYGVTLMQHANNMEEAVQLADRSAQSGDVVLLSPACASLDMFRDFEERGEVFKTLVRGLCA